MLKALRAVLPLLSLLAFGSAPAYADPTLVVHATEWGVAKFHRADNKVHPYDHASAWAPYVLPENAKYGNVITWDNADGSATVVFSTLAELMESVVKISAARHMKVSVLNVHGHGLPGAMWFPATASELNSFNCLQWVQAAKGGDQGNYSQYYSAVSVDDVEQIRSVSENPSFTMGCTTALKHWQQGVTTQPAFKDALADNVHIHFLSCVVGLGSVGDRFTRGVGAAVINGAMGKVEASTYFGLGDWSMPEGMGFWDMQTESQLNHDNEIYVKNRKDREIMQKGTVRISSKGPSGWASSLFASRDFMSLGFEAFESGVPVREQIEPVTRPMPTRVRVPGTGVYVTVTRD